MDESEKFNIEHISNNEENASVNHTHHSHHSHHGHGSSRKYKTEGERRNSDMKKERIAKLLRRILFFALIITLLVLVIWAIFNPNEETKKATTREENVTQKVREDIRTEELQAEIESLKEELDKYEEKIEELEEKLVLSGVETEEDKD